MPGLAIPPGFAQVKLRFRLTGDPEEMISTVGVDPTGSAPTDPTAIAAMAASAFVIGFTPGRVPIAYEFVGASVQMGSDGGDGAVGESIVASQGTMNGSPPPQNVAVLVKKNTALGGRRNRGRFFLPPLVGEGGIGNYGEFESDSFASVQAGLNAFYEQLTDPAGDGTQGLQPVLFHGPGLNMDATPTPIVSFVLDRRVATQRRRLRR